MRISQSGGGGPRSERNPKLMDVLAVGAGVEEEEGKGVAVLVVALPLLPSWVRSDRPRSA